MEIPAVIHAVLHLVLHHVLHPVLPLVVHVAMIHVAIIHVAMIHVDAIAVIAAWNLAHSQNSEKDKIQKQHSAMFAKNPQAMMLIQTQELITLNNATTLHVDQTLAMNVVMERRQENSILTVVLLYARPPIQMDAVLAKLAEKEFQNAHQYLLILL